MENVNTIIVKDDNYCYPTDSSRSEFAAKIARVVTTLLENDSQVVIRYDDVGVYVVEYSQNYNRDYLPEAVWVEDIDDYNSYINSLHSEENDL